MKTKRLERLRSKIHFLIENVQNSARQNSHLLADIHPQYRLSALNLLHYQALRSFDIRKIQRELGNLGLSRLAKSAPHVLASLYACDRVLAALSGRPIPKSQAPFNICEGKKILNSHTRALLGKKRPHRSVRIMVTVPSEAADNPHWAEQMIEAGMDCARINCAHDSPQTWHQMAAHIRAASQKTGKACMICVDLCGPKIRTGAIAKGPQVLHLSPERDEFGTVVSPAALWLEVSPIHPEEGEHLTKIPLAIEPEQWQELPERCWVFVHDTRGKRRTLWIEDKKPHGARAYLFDSTYLMSGTPLYDEYGKKIGKIGQLPASEQKITLHQGDMLILHSDPIEGEPATPHAPAHISCTAKEVFQDTKPGQIVKFDDGKITGIIREVSPEKMLIEITYTKQGGAVLGSDKGINFPQTTLSIKGLTMRDKADLMQVVDFADAIGLSFVNDPDDVLALENELRMLGKNDIGIILKIETKTGFNQLVPVLLAAMRHYPAGVMIARGDLAVECGWEQMAFVQEEILAICQAAHIPAVWATQVLESLAKKGIPSRAEISDAAMSHRADCVMLNKGPYLLEAIKTLDTILGKMGQYQNRRDRLLPALETLQ